MGTLIFSLSNAQSKLEYISLKKIPIFYSLVIPLWWKTLKGHFMKPQFVLKRDLSKVQQYLSFIFSAFLPEMQCQYF